MMRLLFVLALAGCATRPAQMPDVAPQPEETAPWPEQSIPDSLTLA